MLASILNIMFTPLLLTLVAALPQDAPPAPVPASAPVPTYTSLMAEFEQAMGTWQEKMVAMQESGEWEFIPMPTSDFFDKFRIIAKDSYAPPTDRGNSQLWCLQNFTNAGINWKDPKKSAASLAKKFILEFANHELAEAGIQTFSILSWQLGMELSNGLLTDLGKASKDVEIKASCQVAVASNYKHEESEEKAEAICDEVIKKFPKTKAAKAAKQILNQIHNLKVGAIAPSFAGKDVDGNPLALEDFRGKVTLVNFWGFW